MATGKSSYELTADSSGFVAGVKKAERSVEGFDQSQKRATESARKFGKQSSGIDKLKKSFSSLGGVVAGLGLSAAFGKMIANTARQEAAIAQLNTTLNSTQFAAGKTADELQKTAASLQGVTKFGDEAVIEMQSLLLTFKDIKGDNFDRTTEAVLDMATAMKTDLKSASIQLGKALNDPAKNLSALTRSGIQFSESQTEMIKQMQATGDMAGAQAMILKELESQFGGSARAARDTLGGALAGLSNAFGDLFEAETETTDSLKDALNSIERIITSQGFKSSLNFLIESLKTVFSWVGKVYEAWHDLGELIALVIGKWRDIGLFTDELDRQGAALDGVVNNLDLASTFTRSFQKAQEGATGATRDQVFAMGELQEITVDHERAVMADFRSLDLLQEVTVTATRKQSDLKIELSGVKTETEEATKAQGPFADALTHTVERIDEAFAGAWKGAFDSFEDFSKGIIDGFKQMLAELAHLAITRPIVVGISGALGLGGAGSAAAGSIGGTSGAGFLSSITSGISGGFSGLGGLYSGASQMLLKAGNSGLLAGTSFGNLLSEAGLSAGNVAGQYGTGSLLSNAGSLGLNVGAGLLGGYAGNKVFGDTSGIGSAAGGLAGSIFGPAGAGIGSFIGAGIEKGLGNVFGFGGKGGNNAADSFFDLGTGSIRNQGIGNKFDQENLDAVTALTAEFKAFSDAIGGSAYSGQLRVGNTSGIKLDGRKFDSVDQLFDYAFEEILKSATGLEPVIKDLALAFDGTKEQTLLYVTALTSVSELIESNPVSEAVENFARAQEVAGRSLFTQYNRQINNIQRLTANFDGSYKSTINLNEALARNRAAAYEMSIGISQLSDQMTGMFKSSADAIRESVMTDNEIRIRDTRRVRNLVSSLDRTLDPEKLAAKGQEINQLVNSLYSNIEDPTKDQANFAIGILETAESKIQERLKESQEAIRQSQDDQNARISQMWAEISRTQQQAANTSLQGARIFGDWARALIKNGISVDFAAPSEV